jgi:protein-S-isoprenylcysteine O-methyltransferase Ste14
VNVKSKKTILVAAACGAVMGALIALTGNLAKIHDLAYDDAMLDHHRYLLAVIPWVLFSVYWEIASRNSASAKVSESRASRAFHVFLANLALLLEIAPLRGLGRFLPVSWFIMAVGLAVEGFGLFLAIWARRALGSNWSGEISIKVEHQLIRSGPYRLLRHPIYTGLLTMYVGTAVVSGEWLAIVGLALAAFAYWRKIRLEEANLNMGFGADYDAYRGDTWALVPWLF